MQLEPKDGNFQKYVEQASHHPQTTQQPQLSPMPQQPQPEMQDADQYDQGTHINPSANPNMGSSNANPNMQSAGNDGLAEDPLPDPESIVVKHSLKVYLGLWILVTAVILGAICEGDLMSVLNPIMIGASLVAGAFISVMVLNRDGKTLQRRAREQAQQKLDEIKAAKNKINGAANGQQQGPSHG